MGEEPRNMDENMTRHVWGLRPWKRHSTILLVAGLVYIMIGLYYIVGGPNKPRDDSLVVLLQLFPIWAWGIIFMMVGLMACASSIWPRFNDAWGYIVLTGMSSMWAAAYTTGFWFYDARSLSGAIVWGLVAFMWWAISGLLNPDKTGVVSRGPD